MMSSAALAGVRHLLLGDSDSAAAPRRIALDPVSRIEGHLRVEARLENGVIAEAWSCATAFRGVERILAGRDALDLPLLLQRVCGVCTLVHGLTSVRALEDAWGAAPPVMAGHMRNVMLGLQFLHDHVVHFYHLHLLDWLDPAAALAGDPQEALALAARISPGAAAPDFPAVKAALAGFADAGKWGHLRRTRPAHADCRLSPAESLYYMGRYLEALRRQAELARGQAALGGKNPHPQTVVPGGVTCHNLADAARLDALRAELAEPLGFIREAYLPDALHLAARYGDWLGVGRFGRFLSVGEFRDPESGSALFPAAVLPGGAGSAPEAFDVDRLLEHRARSFYREKEAHGPWDDGGEPAWNEPDTAVGAYSWSKAPRYAGEPVEVGPAARVLAALATGAGPLATAAADALARLGAAPEALASVMGRNVCRAVESVVLADAVDAWLARLSERAAGGDSLVFKNYARLANAGGVGLCEAPRGALAHFLRIEGGKAAACQLVVPSTWNMGPRCAAGKKGPLEQALEGIAVADADDPLEALRVVRSFDPCMACAAHLIVRDAGR